MPEMLKSWRKSHGLLEGGTRRLLLRWLPLSHHLHVCQAACGGGGRGHTSRSPFWQCLLGSQGLHLLSLSLELLNLLLLLLESLVLGSLKLCNLVFFIVNEAAALPVRTSALFPECFTHLSLVLWMPVNLSKLIERVGKLTLISVTERGRVCRQGMRFFL